MGIYYNIAAKMGLGELKKDMTYLRLEFNGDTEVIYIGKPKLFSPDIPETSRWYTLPFDFIRSILLRDDGKLILKNYHLEINFNSALNGYNYLVVWVSKYDGEMIVNAFNLIKSKKENELRYNEQIKDNQQNCILVPFKSSAKINLVDFALRNKKSIEECLYNHSQNDTISDDDSIRFLKEIVQNYIADNQLNGIIDEESNEYIDRDFIVKQTKVVNVNVEMDFNKFLQQLGNKGITLTSIQCPQCHATCSIPDVGSQFICESCGALVKVTDLFEKFRKLLE